MSNTINTIKLNAGIMAAAAAKELVDNLQFCKTIGQADPSDYKGKNGFSAGDTIYISKDFRPTVGTTTFDLTSALQDIKEEKVALTLDVLGVVGVQLDSQELASTIDMKSVYKRAIRPAVRSIAQKIEQTMLSRAVLATNAGAVITDVTPTVSLAAGSAMSDQLAPIDDERYMLISPNMMASAVVQRTTLFNASSEISKQYKMGYMGQADGFEWMQNGLLPTISLGNDVTGAAVDDSPATGATTIHIDGITTGTGTVVAGSIITFAATYDVHPITKATLPNLKQFVVVTGGTASGTSDIDIVISPPMYGPTSGPLQNVSALAVNDDAIVFVGAASTAYKNGLAYHKDAFRMVSVPLVMPENAEFAVQETYKGITVAIVRDWDQLTRKMITRVDYLGGFCATRPEWAYRFERAAG